VRQLDRSLLKDAEILEAFSIALKVISDLKRPLLSVEVLSSAAIEAQLFACGTQSRDVRH
jgi:hypothetical protein